jgi:ABC-2 type transport system permease protein
MVELRRFLARRLVRAMTGLIVLGILIGGVTTFALSRRESLSALQARARAERQEQVDACARGKFGIPQEAIPTGMTLQQFCEQTVEVGLNDKRFHMVSETEGFKGTAVPFVLAFLVLSASFIGAEWGAGTITTLLTWEPRRIRVLAAKAIVCTKLAFVGTMVFQALLFAALLPAAVFRGTTAGVDGAWLLELTGVVVRGSALAAIGAAIGFSVAAIARSTAASLGAGFAYLVLLENLVGALRPGWRSWFITSNAIVFINGRTLSELVPRSMVEAAALLVIYALGALVAASVTFARRDVT